MWGVAAHAHVGAGGEGGVGDDSSEEDAGASAQPLMLLPGQLRFVSLRPLLVQTI